MYMYTTPKKYRTSYKSVNKINENGMKLMFFIFQDNSDNDTFKKVHKKQKIWDSSNTFQKWERNSWNDLNEESL